MSEHNITVEGGTSVRLKTAGKYCDRDIVVTAEGGGDTSIEDGLVTGTLTEYENNRVASVGAYAFYNQKSLTKIEMANVESVNGYSFANCTALKKLVLPKAKALPNYCCNGDTSLEQVDILGGGTLYGNVSTFAFANCGNLAALILRNESAVTSLAALVFPYYTGKANITRNFTRAQWNTYGAVGHDESWTGLTSKPAGSITYFTGTVTDEDAKPVWLFGEYSNNATRLTTLAFVETEEEANALMIYYGEYCKTAGVKFYVPAALVDTYKAATNWSTYADRFRALEDYTVDGTITGELDESKIAEVTT